MSAPANDNFANAIALESESGSTAGTTVESSGESSIAELGALLVQNGHDVWFKIRAGYLRNFGIGTNPGFFYAVWTSGAAFRHQIRVYYLNSGLKRAQSTGTGNPGQGKNELCQYCMNMSEYPSAPMDGDGWTGDPPDGWVYVQVDAAPGTTEEGAFTLHWGRTTIPSFGPIGGFVAWKTPPGKVAQFIGMVSISDVTEQNTVWFNSGSALPYTNPGEYYRVCYAGGGVDMAHEDDPMKHAIQADVNVVFNLGATRVRLPTMNGPMPGFDTSGLTPLEIRNAFQVQTFSQSDARIGIEFVDFWGVCIWYSPGGLPYWNYPTLQWNDAGYSDNVVVSAPRFALWRVHG